MVRWLKYAAVDGQAWQQVGRWVGRTEMPFASDVLGTVFGERDKDAVGLLDEAIRLVQGTYRAVVGSVSGRSAR